MRFGALVVAALFVAGTAAADAPRRDGPPLENAAALAPFFASLAASARGVATTRIAWFGDSNIAADGITGTLRARWQQRWGDAGHGFVLVTRGHLPYRHKGIAVSARGAWRLAELLRGGRSDGRYGYGGVLFTAGRGPTSASFSTARSGATGRTASRFAVLYQRHPHGARLELRSDDGAVTELDTRGDATDDAVATLETTDGPHTFTLRPAGPGELRVYGAVLERAAPGVVLDSVGIVGARGRRVLAWDATHLAAQVAARRPQLVVVGFGANEASDAWTGEEPWVAETRAVVRRLRAGAPEAACLVLGAPDQAGPPREGGEPRTFPSLPRRVEGQRRAALAEGCAFWDTFAAMGGAGAMIRWRRAGLGGHDLRHASTAGYDRLAELLDAALLAALDAHGPARATAATAGGAQAH